MLGSKAGAQYDEELFRRILLLATPQSASGLSLRFSDWSVRPCLHGLWGTLAQALRIHVVAADTFGLAADQLSELPVELVVLSGDGQADRKLKYVAALGAGNVAAIGNGRNGGHDSPGTQRGGIPCSFGRGHHYAFAKAQTVVQVNGMGPFNITYINRDDDPQKAKK